MYARSDWIFFVNEAPTKRHQVTIIVAVTVESSLDTCAAGDSYIGGHAGYRKQVATLFIAIVDKERQHLLVVGIVDRLILRQATTAHGIGAYNGTASQHVAEQQNNKLFSNVVDVVAVNVHERILLKLPLC